VPTISRFFVIVIAMFFDDHGHPHFPGGARRELATCSRRCELKDIEPLR
jgi:hypothetical protein